jgi:hypothetical protein
MSETHVHVSYDAMNFSPVARAALAASAAFFPAALQAQDVVFESKSAKASLIELYSSEGCSSCPPAEAWLNGLKTSPGLWRDVFPVAFHVDYWDDLGWPDRLASAAFTQRQRDYATRLGQDSVYTPEFVVNGREWRRGWLSNRIPGEMADKSGDFALTMLVKDGTFTARYTAPATSLPGNLSLNIALLGFNIVSNVTRGENGGQKLQHDFVALGFESFPLTRKGDVFSASALKVTPHVRDAPGAVVTWISNDAGDIVQITGGWLPEAGAAPQTQAAAGENLRAP